MFEWLPVSGVSPVFAVSPVSGRRGHPLKSQDDIFVLDLASDAEDIQAEFRKFHEQAVTPPTDPNLLYTAQHRVMQYALLVDSEMRNFADAHFAAQDQATTDAQWQRAHADLYRFTEPAKERFAHYQELEFEEAEEFRAALRDYVRMCAFLSSWTIRRPGTTTSGWRAGGPTR
ncbi:hypothetical protein [Actinopolyspora halophila]|uniref:hypothetical protein n=1 Tax=Actinopolyspora halophila TaxID=1850 RepID=UPI00036D5837|nr:hypothetical protein [Actinopolyspora halophila]